MVPLVDGQTSSADSAEPPDHGVYYKTKDGWQKLELLTTAGQNIHVDVFTNNTGG
jgi:hypothetical protein